MKRDLYITLYARAQKHRLLSHYTNIEAFENIMYNKALRLSKIEDVNDQFEHKRVSAIWREKLYVGCLTHRQIEVNRKSFIPCESTMFWQLYARGEEGVMITFNNSFVDGIRIFFDEECKEAELVNINRSDVAHKTYKSPSDWGYYIVMFTDIEYTHDLEQYIRIDRELEKEYKGVINPKGEIYNDFSYHLWTGQIKGIEWDNEEETRIIVAVRPKGIEVEIGRYENTYYRPPFKYLYLKLTPEITADMTITLNPWATEDFKARVENIMESSGIEKYKIMESRIKGWVKSP